jgi:Mg2+-importing ATPase
MPAEQRPPSSPPDIAITSAADGGDAYWSRPAQELLRQLQSGLQGLSQQQARTRLRLMGPNVVQVQDEVTAWSLLRRQLLSPLVLILLLGGLVSLILQEWTEATIILSVVAGSVLLATAQEYRASQAMAALRRRLALQARVWRDARLQNLPSAELVAGDVVELSAGQLVPADGIVLQARDFLVSEAALTGESYPVEKRAGVCAPQTPLAQRHNCVWLGSSVRSGVARVLLVRTGPRTAMGRLAQGLSGSPQETAFAHGLRHFGEMLLRVMLLTVVFVLVVNGLLQRPVIDSLLFAVALAVGLSPELLPAIVSVTLSHGARTMAVRGVLVRRLEAIENLGGMDVLCTDKTGTLTAGVIELSAAVDTQGVPCERVRELAYLNAALETGIDNPLDAAIIRAARQAGLALPQQRKIDEIPYDFMRKRLTIVVEQVPATDDAAAQHCIITKGALASVMDICTTLRTAAGEVALDTGQRSRLQAYGQRMGEQGYRILAVASRTAQAQETYAHSDERDLCLEGFLLFFDPPKQQAVQTVRELAALGIAVKVLTGDSRYVAVHVGRAMDLDTQAMLTGEQVAALSDEALWQRAARTVLFVELDPQQKERIVRALQRTGHTVGFLGDGINDAPALHAADVGISVDGAVDVARESADIVLLRPDLDVLRLGVEEGRRTFANTLKYIRITASANFGNMMSMAVVTPVLPFLPLLAKQILLNNFLSDLPSVAVSTDAVDREQVQRAPRWDIAQVQRFMVVFGLISSAFDLLTFALLLWVFDADEATFHTTWFLVSLLTELTVVLVLRTARPAWHSRPGALLLGSTLVVGLLACVLPYLGPVASVFGFVPLGAGLLGASLLVVLAYILATEVAKRRYYRPQAAMLKAG